MAAGWKIAGADEFREFADDLETLSARIPQDVLQDAMEDTAYELVGQITENLEKAVTPKGGTYDSRTSPYSPGGENDSSDDSYHISERDAWYTDVQTIGGARGIIIQPKLEVKDRAYWIEKGTPDHGPSGENPMHFYVNGMHIVMAEDMGENPSITGAEGQEVGVPSVPTEVEGLDSLNYFENAIRAIESRRTFSKNINKHWKKILQEQGFEA